MLFVNSTFHFLFQFCLYSILYLQSLSIGSFKMKSVQADWRSRWSLKRFVRSTGGSIGMIFGIFLIPALGIMGMGMDFSTAVSARSNIQSIADAAALAAGREFQISGDVAAAEAKAESFFNAGVASLVGAGSRFTIPSPNITVDPVEGTMKIVINGVMQTGLLQVLGFNEIALGAESEAVLAMGGGDQDLEVAMMLDVTGSMGGSKISDMKLAAKDLVEILVANNQTEHTSRIALAPFSRAVKAGSYFNAVTGDDPVSSNKTCITERIGAEKFSDATPGAGQYVEKYSGSYCKPTASIVPLSSNKALLNSTIDSFSATGATAGHLGTAWAWYLVSPNWNSIWPAASQAAQYGAENVIKAVILMTDGQYNTQYSSNGSSQFQARKICDNIKGENVVVYTVGFALTNSSAIQTMQHCASTESHYYLAENGDELRLAFRDIAFKLAQLRLSK